MSDIHVCAT
jgi:hypothetical protein